MEEKQNDEGQEYCGLADVAFEVIYEDKLTAKNCCKYTIPTHTTLPTILNQLILQRLQQLMAC